MTRPSRNKDGRRRWGTKTTKRKTLFAEAMLDNAVLKDLNSKKVTPA
jgi:hypothetical protein